MPTKPIVGLHHVTAIAGDPQRNLDFYTDVLGLRFVKKTVTSMIQGLTTSTSGMMRGPLARS